MPVLRTLGDYELVEQIAEGGMGVVYKARRRDTGEAVAIKLSPPHLAKNPIMLRRFEQEYNAAKDLCHPNIVRALDYGFDGICPFLVMEYVDGESLGQRVERDGYLPEAEAIRIISQVSQGLQKAHKRGLIHRDVKPDNILMNSQGQAKLTDLGLVKEMDTDLNLTRTGRGLGTPHFMSPEQFRDAKNVDARSDIYALAATLYQLVTGELPFGNCGPVDAYMKKVNNELIPPREIMPQLSERIDWAIRRAMHGDRAQRPRNCREFIEDLTGRSTRELTPIANDNSEEGMWYMVYKDEESVIHTAKGTVDSLRQALKEGRMGDLKAVRGSKSKLGPFEFLRAHPEFRDLVFEPPASKPLKMRRKEPMTNVIIDEREDPLARSPVRSTPARQAATQSTAALPGSAVRKERPRAGTSTPACVAETVVHPTPAPAAAAAAVAAPHIHMTKTGTAVDWQGWAALVFLAVVAGAVGYFILPLLP